MIDGIALSDSREKTFRLTSDLLFDDFQKTAAILEQAVADGAGPEDAHFQSQRFLLIGPWNEDLNLLAQKA